MNLPPDKLKLLSQYDSDKKWELVCDEVRSHYFIVHNVSQVQTKSLHRTWLLLRYLHGDRVDTKYTNKHLKKVCGLCSAETLQRSICGEWQRRWHGNGDQATNKMEPTHLQFGVCVRSRCLSLCLFSLRSVFKSRVLQPPICPRLRVSTTIKEWCHVGSVENSTFSYIWCNFQIHDVLIWPFSSLVKEKNPRCHPGP